MESQESKSFDKILKENLEEILLPLSKKLLGFEIIKSELLPEKLQTTIEREPDFLRIVETENKERFILHLEFQTNNDPDMIYREAEYKAILQRKYRLTVRQYVIFLGNKKPSMQTMLPETQQITGYELKNIHDLSYDSLTTSEIPEEIILAILGDFHQIAPEVVIRQIIDRLQQVSRSELELKKYVRQLNILSRLRRLDKETIKITEAMPITYDIKKDYLFQQGIEQGIEQGMRKKQREMIINLLKFSDLSTSQVALIANTTEDIILQIKKELE